VTNFTAQEMIKRIARSLAYSQAVREADLEARSRGDSVAQPLREIKGSGARKG